MLICCVGIVAKEVTDDFPRVMREGSGRTSSFFHNATPQRQLSPLPLVPGLKDMRLTHAAPQLSPSFSFLLGLPVATICEPQTNSKKFLMNP